jgi:hypothetical protein
MRPKTKKNALAGRSRRRQRFFLAVSVMGSAILCMSLVLLSQAAPKDIASPEIPALNRAIVKFCQENLGQQVGSGECCSLAGRALKAAGVEWRYTKHVSPGANDYVWGRLIVTVEAGTDGGEPKVTGQVKRIMPGDVLQFRDTVFRSGKKRSHYGHHTAIVAGVEEDGGGLRLKLLQQNTNEKRFVTEGRVDLGALKEGWVRVYEPQVTMHEGKGGEGKHHKGK